MITPAEVANTYKGFDTSGIKGLELYTPPNMENSIKAATSTGTTTAPITAPITAPTTDGGITNLATATKPVDWAAATKQFVTDNPFATPEQIAAAVSGSGIGTQNLNTSLNTLVDSGQLSAAERNYILSGKGLSGLAANNMQWLKEHPDATNQQITDISKEAGLSRDAALLPLTHGYQVAEDKDSTAAALKYLADNKDVAKWLSSTEGQSWMKEHPEFDSKDIAWTHYKRYGEAEQRKWGADQTKTTGGTDGTTITAPVTYNTAGTNVPSSLESTLGLPPGVSGAGATTVNPNGTITTRPDFSLQMRDVRDAYTKGGGSLGYTSPSFTNIDDFTKKYVTDRMSGDSLDAYNYLSGKGGAQYPIKSRVGQISRPYDEAVLGYPARGNLPYTYNKATGKMDVNPDYVAPGRDAAGNVTYTMSLNEIKNTLKDAPLSGQALYDWATTNNLSAQQIADATNQSLSSVYAQFRAGAKAAAAKKKTDAAAAAGETDVGSSNQPFQGAATGGMMGYADGGITGNGQLNLNIPLNLGGAGGANGYNAMGGGFGSAGGYQTQSNQNSVQQSGMPDYRNAMQGFDAQIQKLPSIMAYNDYTKSLGNRQATTDEMAQVEQLRKGIMGDQGFLDLQSQMQSSSDKYRQQAMSNQSPGLQQRYAQQSPTITKYAEGGYAIGGGLGTLGSYSDGGRLLRGPGDGVSDSIPATIGRKQQPARLADGEFVVPARIVSELGNGSTDAGAKKLYAMMDRVQRARGKTTGKNKVAANSRADKYLPA